MIVIYFVWKQACYFCIVFVCVFFFLFYFIFQPISAIGWYLWIRYSQKSCLSNCTFSVAVKSPLSALLSHPHRLNSYAVPYLLLSGLWIMCLLLCFLPVFAHLGLVIFHLPRYTVITVTSCASMVEKWKARPFTLLFNPVSAKETEDSTRRNMLSNWDQFGSWKIW